MTISLRLQMSPAQQARLDSMDKRQHAWMSTWQKRLAAAEGSNEQMGGRQSGPEEWRLARDELAPDPRSVREIFQIRSEPDQLPCQIDRIDRIDRAASNNIHSLSDSSEFYLFGNARRTGGGTLVLTDGPDQTSAFFFEGAVPHDKSWCVILDVRIATPPDQPGADGLALVFSSERGIGQGGYGMGYDGLGRVGDWAVESQSVSARLGWLLRSHYDLRKGKLKSQSTHTDPRIEPMIHLCPTSRFIPLQSRITSIVCTAQHRASYRLLGTVKSSG